MQHNKPYSVVDQQVIFEEENRFWAFLRNILTTSLFSVSIGTLLWIIFLNYKYLLIILLVIPLSIVFSNIIAYKKNKDDVLKRDPVGHTILLLFICTSYFLLDRLGGSFYLKIQKTWSFSHYLLLCISIGIILYIYFSFSFTDDDRRTTAFIKKRNDNHLHSISIYNDSLLPVKVSLYYHSDFLSWVTCGGIGHSVRFVPPYTCIEFPTEYSGFLTIIFKIWNWLIYSSQNQSFKVIFYRSGLLDLRLAQVDNLRAGNEVIFTCLDDVIKLYTEKNSLDDDLTDESVVQNLFDTKSEQGVKCGRFRRNSSFESLPALSPSPISYRRNVFHLFYKNSVGFLILLSGDISIVFYDVADVCWLFPLYHINLSSGEFREIQILDLIGSTVLNIRLYLSDENDPSYSRKMEIGFAQVSIGNIYTIDTPLV